MTLSDQATQLLIEDFAGGYPPGKLQAMGKVKEQLRVLLPNIPWPTRRPPREGTQDSCRGCLTADTNMTYRTFCACGTRLRPHRPQGPPWKSRQATPGKMRTARGYPKTRNYKSALFMRSAVRTAA